MQCKGFYKACISYNFVALFFQREYLCLLMKRSFLIWWRTLTVSTVGIQLLHLNITSKRDILDSPYIIKILALVIKQTKNTSTTVVLHRDNILHPFSALMLSVLCDREVFYPLLLCWWRPWQEPLALPNVHKNIAKDKGLQNPYYQPWFVFI